MPELIDKAKLLEYLAAIKPDEYVSAYGEAAVDVINHVEKYVAEMPTIEPERKKGHINICNGFGCCSECGKRIGIGCANYCGYCGAELEV